MAVKSTGTEQDVNAAHPLRVSASTGRWKEQELLIDTFLARTQLTRNENDLRLCGRARHEQAPADRSRLSARTTPWSRDCASIDYPGVNGRFAREREREKGPSRCVCIFVCFFLHCALLSLQHIQLPQNSPIHTWPCIFLIHFYATHELAISKRYLQSRRFFTLKEKIKQWGLLVFWVYRSPWQLASS